MITILRRGLALLLAVTLVGCQTMQPVSQPRDFMSTRQPSVVWLSRTSDQTLVAVDAPKLMGDSVVGFIEGEYSEIALSQIRAMHAKQYSRGRTMAFLAGVGALTIGAFLVINGGVGAGHDMDGEDDIGLTRFPRR